MAVFSKFKRNLQIRPRRLKNTGRCNIHIWNISNLLDACCDEVVKRPPGCHITVGVYHFTCRDLGDELRFWDQLQVADQYLHSSLVALLRKSQADARTAAYDLNQHYFFLEEEFLIMLTGNGNDLTLDGKVGDGTILHCVGVGAGLGFD